jgi:hypothetical protein
MWGLAYTYRGIGPYRGIDLKNTHFGVKMQSGRPQVTSGGLRRALSETRWCAYKRAAGHSDVQVLACYLWSMELSAALQPTLHLLEVTLRNALFDHSCAILQKRPLQYDTVDCWLDAVPSLLTPKHNTEVMKAKADLKKQKRDLTSGRLVAALGFGFWTGLFDSQYEHGRPTGPRIWPELAQRAFPNLEKSARHRAHLARHFYELRILRNRIAHYEPTWKLDALSVHERFCEAIGWMNASAMYLVKYKYRHSLDVLCAAGPDLFADDASLLLGDCLTFPANYR